MKKLEDVLFDDGSEMTFPYAVAAHFVTAARGITPFRIADSDRNMSRNPRRANAGSNARPPEGLLRLKAQLPK
ncbi:MAG TPA: hypothetical protein VIK02_03345 [Candidatus Anoxymicrobiaceae bacterium]